MGGQVALPLVEALGHLWIGQQGECFGVREGGACRGVVELGLPPALSVSMTRSVMPIGRAGT